MAQGSLLGDLALGLRQAAGVLNPDVQKQTFSADEREEQMKNKYLLERAAAIHRQQLEMADPLKRQLLEAQVANQRAVPEDRRIALETRKQLGLQNLYQKIQRDEQLHQDRMRTITRQEDRDRETIRHNRVMEGNQATHLAIAGEKLEYDTGRRVQLPPVQADQLPPVQADPLAGILSGRPPEEQAAIRGVASAEQSGQGYSADVEAYNPMLKVMQPSGYGMTQERPVASGMPSEVTSRAAQYGPEGRFPPVTASGIPVAVTALTSPAMPQFFGSPREVARQQNEWIQEQAKATSRAAASDVKAKAKIDLAGGRESTQINRVVMAGNQASKDLDNIAQLPLTVSRGIFGGRKQGPSLFEAAKETLTTTMTTQEVQTYNVMATGFQRSLAAIEAIGLAPTNALVQQMDAVILKEGDTNLTKMQKLAQIRQIIEAGMETTLSNPRVPSETKQHIQGIVDRVRTAVPYTQRDMLKLMQMQQNNPNATLNDVLRRQTTSDGIPVTNW